MNINSKMLHIVLKICPLFPYDFLIKWWKKFGYSTAHTSAIPPFVSKLLSLQLRLLTIHGQIIFGNFLDPKKLLYGRNFRYLDKVDFWNFWHNCSVHGIQWTEWKHNKTWNTWVLRRPKNYQWTLECSRRVVSKLHSDSQQAP